MGSGIGIEIGIQDSDWDFGLGFWILDSGLGFGIGLRDWDSGFGIRIQDSGLGFGIEIGIRIQDWD